MSAPLASVDGISKRFGSIQALNDLSLSVPEGSVCGLLGPNGSGKTTAIRILLGLSRANSGTAELLGTRVGGRGFKDVISRTGSLIEGPALYGRGTARQNMKIQARARGLDSAGSGIDRLLELVGLTDRADTNARGFSLGMKQRLGLAIALIGNPRLVILDEPTNGLDPSGIVEIRELIKRLPQSGVTVLVSSHLLSEVQLMCDRATIINHGSVVADGTMSEILGQAGGDGGYMVRVTPEEVPEAYGILSEIGLSVFQAPDGELLVDGPVEDGSQINLVLANAGIYVSELRKNQPDLERVFMSLTHDPNAPVT
ncbi:MAG: ABC transporter ATP-binding protein [Thermoleophilia bacterium]|nr:ABC transporter ATP-binding protein [Thermoleophilia bacterium]